MKTNKTTRHQLVQNAVRDHEEYDTAERHLALIRKTRCNLSKRIVIYCRPKQQKNSIKALH